MDIYLYLHLSRVNISEISHVPPEDTFSSHNCLPGIADTKEGMIQFRDQLYLVKVGLISNQTTFNATKLNRVKELGLLDA